MKGQNLSLSSDRGAGFILTLLKLRIFCALLGFFVALIVALLEHRMSARYIGSAYIGLDGLFSLLGLLFDRASIKNFKVPYGLLTVVWLALAVLLIAKFT